MRLARINDDMILNLDDVQFAIWDEDCKRVLIAFKSNGNSVTTTNKKVLDAICGSEEHLEKNEQIISEVINNLKKIDNISSVKIEYIRSDLGQPGGFLVQKN